MAQGTHHSGELTEIWQAKRPTIDQVMNFEIGRSSESDGVMGTITAPTLQEGGRVSTSTGLGLPLCRSFAVAGGGWVSITDAPDYDGSNGLLSSAVTQFWAVLPLDVVSLEGDVVADIMDVKLEIGESGQQLTVSATQVSEGVTSCSPR